jgi:hypothetical protein
MAKINGGVAEAEAAGGSPRKKPHGSSPRKKPCGEETFFLRLDWAKATAEHDSRMEPIGFGDDPDDRADGGRPTKGPTKTTKAPPVTQEDNGVDDLYSEEEEADSKDDEGLEDGVAARDKATHESILARPRRAKRDGSADDRTDGGRPKNSLPKTTNDLDNDDDEELDAAHDEATCESILACPHRATHDGGANYRTDGGRPKNSLPKTTGDLEDDDEELDNGDTEDKEDLEDDGKTAPMVWAGTPPPKCRRRCLAQWRCLVRPLVGKPR